MGLALKGADARLVETLLRSMPRRQVQAFEDMRRRVSPTPVSRVEQARREIMEQVRELADAGEIELQLVAEDVM